MTALEHHDHRPWELPSRPYVMHMNWVDLLFMHWALPVEVLRPFIPKDLEIDTFDGCAWIGIVPFRMTGVRPRFCPSMPWLSAFPELNVRTYVVTGGKPGVWFFSLDATSKLTVRGARTVFHLPYFDAQMSLTETNERIDYHSHRTHKNAPEADFDGWYRPAGDVYYSRAGSLDHWLTERYCLYAANSKGRVFRGDIHHAPWPLQKAEADISKNTMLEAAGIAMPKEEPLLHFARFIDVVAWNLESL